MSFIVFLPVEYIRYLLKAKGRHGTHSPFVYDFVENCIPTKVDKNFESLLKSITKKCATDQNIIHVRDFGAGSRSGKQKVRKVSSIFKNASSHGKYGRLLYSISKHYNAKNILEFGTSLGIGTFMLHAGRSNVQVHTVEACTETLGAAIRNFDLSELKNIVTFNAQFQEFIDLKPNTKYDIIFIDGHHDGPALLNYLNSLDSLSHDETIFILDDIRWSQSMLDAWNSLVKDEKYHVTIDLFRMGILLKRNHQQKEHFTIKI